MARFLLIHGASHGAWCWHKIVARLEKLGHEAVAIDLPSHGDDHTPPERITIHDYVARTLEAMKNDTILVGHSLGGLTITLAAAAMPEKTRALVYLCAFVPPPGVPATTYRPDAVTGDLVAAQRRDRLRGVTVPDPDLAGEVFYSDCSYEDRAFALPRLSPQPIAVMTEVLEFDPPDVPRHYIRCLKDRAVKPSYQRDICASWPSGTVHELDCGHSPFFSTPGKLVEILGDIASS